MARYSLFAVPVLLVGCGGTASTGTLSGKVSLKGQPVMGAQVSMISSKTGSGAIAEIGQDGAFEFREALPVGSYKVAIVPKPPEPVAPGTRISKGPPSSIPLKYQRIETSGFNAEIKGGRNETTFAIP